MFDFSKLHRYAWSLWRFRMDFRFAFRVRNPHAAVPFGLAVTHMRSGLLHHHRFLPWGKNWPSFQTNAPFAALLVHLIVHLSSSMCSLKCRELPSAALDELPYPG